MAYATQDDIVRIYGEDALFVADRDRDGVADAGAVGRALDEATAEIDSFVGTRYDLPFDGTPAILRQAAVDIALYRLSGTSTTMSEERRDRYKDTVSTLRRIASGEQTLPRKRTDLDRDGRSDGPRPIVVEGEARIFSRDRLRRY